MNDEKILKDSLSNIAHIDFLMLTNLHDDIYTVRFSDKSEITLKLPLWKILEIVKLTPNNNLCISKDNDIQYSEDIFVLNGSRIARIEDEYILFKDGVELKNFYYNKEILIDSYQLPVQLLDCIF